MQVALYLRVSTTEQSTDSQEHDLRAVASRMGWAIVKVSTVITASAARRAAISVQPSMPCSRTQRVASSTW
jgi:DNA invertase Pin-like site-specific DNA recombinase